MSGSPVFYDELASWWPLISPPEEYAEEASSFADLLRRYSKAQPVSLLELGSGGGCNAFHLKHVFPEITLVDLAPGMLKVSQDLNPECEHLLGDMFSIRLEREFDCCFVHDAICYATSLDQLRAVLETAYLHLKSEGVALFAPDFVRETFRESTGHGGYDSGNRGIRYLEWTWDPDPEDSTYLADYAFLIREGAGEPRVVHDRHVEGLFSRAEWMSVLRDVGFEPQVVEVLRDEKEAPSVVFIGLRTGAPEG